MDGLRKAGAVRRVWGMAPLWDNRFDNREREPRQGFKAVQAPGFHAAVRGAQAGAAVRSRSTRDHEGRQSSTGFLDRAHEEAGGGECQF